MSGQNAQHLAPYRHEYGVWLSFARRRGASFGLASGAILRPPAMGAAPEFRE